MSKETPQTPEENREAIAKETLRICTQGAYESMGVIYDIQAQINKCLEGTKLFKEEPPLAVKSGGLLKIEVTTESATAAILRHERAEHIAVLNFASATRPGGGFLNGAQAQEECLARASALYPSLLKKPEFYEHHRKEGGTCYTDQAIWSPHVPFFRDEGDQLGKPFSASVITCAAPNKSAMAENLHEELPAIFEKRIRRVLTIAAHQKVTHLILGAWGCGVFGNDPTLVAKIFKKALDEVKPHFQTITFAIFCPRGPDETFKTFQKELKPNQAA